MSLTRTQDGDIVKNTRRSLDQILQKIVAGGGAGRGRLHDNQMASPRLPLAVRGEQLHDKGKFHRLVRWSQAPGVFFYCQKTAAKQKSYLLAPRHAVLGALSAGVVNAADRNHVRHSRVHVLRAVGQRALSLDAVCGLLIATVVRTSAGKG